MSETINKRTINSYKGNYGTIDNSINTQNIKQFDKHIENLSHTINNNVTYIDIFSNKLEEVSTKSKLASLGIESFASAAGESLVTVVASLAINIISDALYNMTHAAEIAQQKMEDTAQTYGDACERVTSLNEQLASTSSRMHEIIAQGTINIASQKDLEILKQQTTEMERQSKIESQLALIQGKQLANDTENAFNKTFKYDPLNVSEASINEYKDNYPAPFLDASAEEDLNAAIALLQIWEEEKEKATSPEDIAAAQEMIDSTNASIWDKLGEFQKFRSNLLSVPAEVLADSQSTLLTNLDATISKTMEYVDPTYDMDKKLNGIFAQSDFSYLRDNLIDAAIQGGSGLDDLIANTEGFESALSSAGLTTEDLKSYITELADSSNKSLTVLKESLKDTFEAASDSADATKQKDFETWLNTLDDSQIKLLYEATLDTDTAQLSLADWMNMLRKAEAESITFDSVAASLNEVITATDALNAAMVSSVSGKGLNTQQLENVIQMYEGLDGYDPSKLFEKTANGIHLNTDELKKLQKQYEDIHKQDFAEKIAVKQRELNELYNQGANDAIIQSHLAEIENLQLLQNQYEGLTSAYNKWLMVRSAGEEGNTYDTVTNTMLSRGKELLEANLIGTNEFAAITQFMTNEDLSGANPQYLKDVFAQQAASMERYYTSDSSGVYNFLNDTEQKGLGKWNVTTDDAGNELSRSFEFVGDAGKKLAEEFGYSTEFFDFILQKAHDYGIDSNYEHEDPVVNNGPSPNSTLVSQPETQEDPYSLENIQEKINQYTTALEQFNNSKNSGNLDNSQIEMFDAQKRSALEYFNAIPEEVRTLLKIEPDTWAEEILSGQKFDFNIDSSETVDSMNTLREQAVELYAAAQENPTATAYEDYLNLVSLINSIPPEITTKAYFDITQPENGFLNVEQIVADYQAAMDVLNNSSADTQLRQNASDTLQNILSVLNSTDASIIADLKVEGVSKEEIEAQLQNGGTPTVPAKVVTQTETDATEIDNYTNTVESTNPIIRVNANLAPAIAAVAAWNPGSKLISIIPVITNDTSKGTKHGYGTYGGGQSGANGTAHAAGTVRLAGTTGAALLTGTAHALAARALHLDYMRTHHPSVYTAFAGGNWGLPYDQTALVGELAPEMLVRNGRWQLIGQNGAGFMGLKRGDIIFNHLQTRQLLENGWVTGRGRPVGFNSHVMGTVSQSALTDGTAALPNSAYADTPITSTVRKIKEASEDFCDAMDYISIALDRMTEAIDHNKSLANLYSTYRDQNPELDKAIAQSGEKLKFSQRAYDRYMAQADASGLDEQYKKQIQNGQLDISNITDERLKAQIDDYQDWYEKAQDVRKELIDIGKELQDLNLQKLENITDDFDQIISYEEALLNVMETINDLNQLKGISITESDMMDQMNTQADISGYYAGELKRLTEEFQSMVDSGVIVEFSDDWWQWNETIQKTKASLLDSNKALLELKNDILELRMDPFNEAVASLDDLSDRLAKLDDLINDNTIFSENGSLTNAGLTRAGLLGQQLAAAKQQTAEYANAIAALKANLENGNISQDKYNEQLKEYTAGQNQAVSATKKAMDAIIDLVKDGIDKEADAYGKLIDARKKDLQAARDYEDYVEEIEDKQAKINAKEAQIAAMEGDETKTQQLRKLKKELAELRKDYDKTVDKHNYDAVIQGYDDAKQAFEDNAKNAQQTLDTNFDARQQAIMDTLGLARDNFDEVYTYLGTLAAVYGTTLTEDVVNPWLSASAAVDNYKAAVDKAAAGTVIDTSPIKVEPKPATDTNPSQEKENSSIIKPIVDQEKPREPEIHDPSANTSNIFNGIPESASTKGASWLNANGSINDRLYWNGYQGGSANQRILYNNLNGASVHGGYSGSMAQNMWLLDQLKARGFKNGGFIDVDPAFALNAANEKVLAMARPGEYIMTKQQSTLFTSFMDRLPALDSIIAAPTLLDAASSDTSRPVTIHVDSMIGSVGTLEKRALPELEVILTKACDKFENRLRQEFKRPQYGGIAR